jgi:hypothetical protein
MKGLLIAVFVASFSLAFSQEELTIFRLEHNRSASCDFYDELGEHLGRTSSFRHSTEGEMNVGWELNKNNELGLSIQYGNRGTRAITNPNNDSLISLVNLPSHSFLSISGVLSTEFRKSWVFTNSISTSFVDDFWKGNYRFKVFGGVSSFIKKNQTPKFKWGGGVFINQLAGRIQFFPLIYLQLKNEKRGFEFSFPEQARLWQSLNVKSYLQLGIRYNSFSLSRLNASNEEWFTTDINSFRMSISYQYVYEEFLRFTVGIGAQFRSNLISSEQKQYGYSQIEMPTVNIGLAWVFIEN